MKSDLKLKIFVYNECYLFCCFSKLIMVLPKGHFMPNTPRPIHKTALVSAIAMLMSGVLLSACQSIPTPNHTSTITHATQVSPSQTAKQAFISSLSHHLNSERYAVSSTRYVAEPLYISDIDKEADSAWTTATKVMAFKDKARYDDYLADMPFMTYDDYFGWSGELGELPYLRYGDDEDAHTVTRTVGMSDEYQAVSAQILDLYAEINDHLLSADARNFLNDKGQFNQNAFKKDLLDFDKKINQTANELLKVAQGYQISDIRHLQSCVSDYKNQKLTLTKNIKSHTELDNIVEALYRLEMSSSHCAVAVWYDTQLEPSYYINDASEQTLNTHLAQKQCLAKLVSTNRQLFSEGKNHHTHADDFRDNLMQYSECDGSVVEPSTYHDTDRYEGVSGFIKAYKDMKAQDADQSSVDVSSALPAYLRMGMLGSLLNLKQTPEQTVAKNLYQYQNLSLSGLSHHSPTTQVVRSLYSIDYDTPTIVHSAQFPLMFDHNKGELNADVSALLPLMALIAPKHAPMLKDVPDGLVSFTLPQELREQIPTDVIYRAINDGIVAGVNALHSEKFTPVDFRDDLFAKEVGASRVIKITLGSKELGTLYGVIAKHVGASLNTYVQENPAYYPNTSDETDDNPNKIKQLIDNFTTLNGSYHSSDVGGLLQVIEAVMPFSLDGTAYVYLDSSGKIIALQNISHIQDQISHTTTQSIQQIRYDKKLFDKHLLSRQFNDTFSKTAQVDGTAFFTRLLEEQKFAQEVRYARYDYAYDTVLSSSAQACANEPEGDTCMELTYAIENAVSEPK